MKRKNLLHVIGLALVALTFIPPMPTAIKIIIALIPLTVFAVEMLFNYTFCFLKKEYVNEYLAFLLATVAILCTGNVTQAALTVILCSAAVSIFKDGYDKAQRQIDTLCNIVPKKAKLVTINGLKTVPLAEIAPGDSIVIVPGSIIPVDGTVVNGGGRVDYTNIFGPSRPVECVPGAKCYSGGTLQAGKLTVQASTTAERSIASVMDTKTKKAHNMSDFHAKISNISKIFQIAMLLLALVLFIALYITTKKFGYSMNIASVLILGSTVIGMTKMLPLIYHISLLKGRRKGVIFRDTVSLERLSKIQTFCPDSRVSEEALDKIEETGVIPAKNPTTELDAAVYRSKAELEAQKEPVFKIAMGFFSANANLTVYDSNTERIASAIRLSRTYKSVFWENTVYLILGKLALITLAFLLGITPALAMIIEFAVWMICLINATKKA